MTTLFYAHLVPIDETLDKLSNYELSEEEYDALENKILAMYHHRIIDTILTHLDQRHHDSVIEHIATDPHNLDIMIYIKSLNPEIEDHIIDAGKVLSSELHGLLHRPNNVQ